MQQQLRRELLAKVGSVSAEIGLAVRGVDFDLQVDIGSEQTFRSASIIKVPLLAALFWLSESGGLDWQQTLSLRETDRTLGSGILRHLHTGLTVTLYDLAVLMIVLSDNTATNMIIDYVGVETVAGFLQELGLHRTTLQRKMYNFGAAEQGKENLCCAAEIADLLQQMAQGEIRASKGSVLVSRQGCEQMLQMMQAQFYRDLIPYLLPQEAKVANKTGEVSGHHHDCAVVWTPNRCYSLAVLTRGFEHRRVAAQFIADLSLTIYESLR
jgi:beta-lactamase class A